MQNHIKYLARIMVETATPLRVGSGNAGLLVDQLVARDANELPYIPGTSLTGVIRHELSKRATFTTEIDRLFGFQKFNISDKDTEIDKGQGSRIVFSSAQLLAVDGVKVHEGLQNIDFSDAYYQPYQDNLLPERDHVKINHKGVATTYGKYEEQLIYKGTRFVFEMELTGTANDKAAWQELLSILQQPTFRIGAGTRKGFGALKILKTQQKTFDLTNKQELVDYLEISSSLDENFTTWETSEISDLQEHWLHYSLTLTPENFFLFGAGLQDTDADETPKTEKIFNWVNGKAVLSEEKLVIPATSVKGAISHRVAYHYNQQVKLTIETASSSDMGKVDLETMMQSNIANIDLGIVAEQLNFASDSPEWDQLIATILHKKAEETQDWLNFQETITQKQETASTIQSGTGELNEAVVALFGSAKTAEEGGQRGRVIFSDVFVEKAHANEKVFNHVAIDRFTGGGIDGALFQEKVTTSDSFTLDIYVDKVAFETEHVQAAFEQAIADLKSGNLPLGGYTTKGHGVFLGQS